MYLERLCQWGRKRWKLISKPLKCCWAASQSEHREMMLPGPPLEFLRWPLSPLSFQSPSPEASSPESWRPLCPPGRWEVPGITTHPQNPQPMALGNCCLNFQFTHLFGGLILLSKSKLLHFGIILDLWKSCRRANRAPGYPPPSFPGCCNLTHLKYNDQN